MCKSTKRSIVVCNDRCNMYKAEVNGQLSRMGAGPYIQGFKRCNTCNIFLNDSGVVVNNKGISLCKCCGFRLSYKPKRPSARRRLKDNLLEKIQKADEKMLRRLL
jgi:hypothetical protein